MTISREQRLGMAADHQRGGKGPRLRGEIAHAPANNAGLVAGFPPHRVLDRLPGLDEAGEARPHAGLKAMRAAEHATLARDREHDHDRIRAGESCARHTGQSRRQPASTRSVAAPHVEQKRCRPCQLSSALPSASGGEMVRLDQAAHRDRAQIGHDEFLTRLEHFGGLRARAQLAYLRRVAAQPEKDDLCRGAKRARLRQREQRIANGARVLEDYRIASDQIGTDAC